MLKALSAKETTAEIFEALIAREDDKIWASELEFPGRRHRADLWTLHPHPSQGYQVHVYEIKSTRQDFKADSFDKQKDALEWSDYFWYVTPVDLIHKDELPEWAGLWEWNGAKLKKIRRAPRRSKAKPTWEMVVSILRYSERCRRDTGLLKSQLAFYEHQYNQFCEQRDRRQKWQFDEWLKANQSDKG